MAPRLALASALLLVTAGAVHQGVAFASQGARVAVPSEAGPAVAVLPDGRPVATIDDLPDPRLLQPDPRPGPTPSPEPGPDEGCVVPAVGPGLPSPIGPCSSPPRRRALTPGWCVTPAVFYGDPRPRPCAESPRLAPLPPRDQARP